jgi:hypothetical protein
MGAWGVDSFGNDDAADWAWTLDDSSDLAIVEATLASADVDAEHNLDASVASMAIAAAEAVARLRGAGGEQSAYSESVDNWVKRIGKPPAPSVVERAIRILDRIAGSNSELRELWEESEEFVAWSAAIQELRARLTASV